MAILYSGVVSDFIRINNEVFAVLGKQKVASVDIQKQIDEIESSRAAQHTAIDEKIDAMIMELHEQMVKVKELEKEATKQQ